MKRKNVPMLFFFFWGGARALRPVLIFAIISNIMWRNTYMIPGTTTGGNAVPLIESVY